MVNKNNPMDINIQKWVSQLVKDMPRKDEEKAALIQFWTEFYNNLLNSNAGGKQDRTKSDQYKGVVFDLLRNGKENGPLTEDKLKTLQLDIESYTSEFDEESMFKSAPNIFNLLIDKSEPCAKDFLRGCKIDKEDIELVSEFGQYTIEALIVHELGQLFHSFEHSSIIRVATLVERLESCVRIYASLLKSRRKHNSTATDNEEMMSGKKRKSKMEKLYPFGTSLVNFMENKKLINLISGLDGPVRAQKKQGHYYLPSHLYAVCNFDISLLPIKLNLPMVCKPKDWTSNCPQGQKPRYLSDLSGGYLSMPTKEMYARYRLLSSTDKNHFYIDIEDNYLYLCRVMNKLQSQAFQINSKWLNYILLNKKLLVENGFLMPEFLVNLDLLKVSSKLREYHMNDVAGIQKLCSFSELFSTICKNIQRASYDKLILELASAYDGYHFYLPAFLDFRGRIYRSGVLHFHERDLARSLILFADIKSMEIDINNMYEIVAATAFHYKSFDSDNDAYNWVRTRETSEHRPNPLLLAQGAKRPCQFIANLLGIRSYPEWDVANIPITQDASASAYQIMSYFLLDEPMAKNTNLIQSKEGKILDIYSIMLKDLKEFMKDELDTNLSKVVIANLTRKIVKGIFMPIIYGKTLQSTASDLQKSLSHYITFKECFAVASVCFKFFRTKYPGMDSLIRLIRDLGWIASASDRPVIYGIPYCTTVQDYMVMEPVHIWVYDRIHKKRRRVTLRVSSSKRDSRKTEIATFVNFIHQRDACVAMRVVDEMLEKNAPIYTVHDNFLTTSQYSHTITSFYSKAFFEMGPPLSIINEFIYMNAIQPILKMNGLPLVSMEIEKMKITRKVIPKEILKTFLEAYKPEMLTKNMRASWDARITRILTSYEEYTRIVCCDKSHDNSRVCWNAHEQKWDDFKFKLKRREYLPYYCVHH